MIWFNINDLEQQISTNRLSEKNGFNYLLASTIYGFIYMLYATMSTFTYLTLIDTGIAIVITIIFFPIIYKINASIDNKDFIKRFIAIGWVVRMKLLIYTLVFMFLYFNFFDPSSPSITQNVILSVFSIAMNLLFYVLIINSFKRLKPINVNTDKI